MAAITWRNINTPSFRDSNSLYASGIETTQKAIEGLSNTLGDYVARNKKETEDSIKSLMDSFKTEADFGAAAKSGASSPDKLTEMFGSNFDPRAISDYGNSRISAIRDKAEGEYKRGELLQSRKESPLIEQFNNDIIANRNDNTALKGLMSEISNSGIKNSSPLVKSIASYIDRNTNKSKEETRKEEEYNSLRDSLLKRYELANQKQDNPGTPTVNPNSPEEALKYEKFINMLIEKDEDNILGPVKKAKAEGYTFKTKDKKGNEVVNRVDVPTDILNAAFLEAKGERDWSEWDVQKGDFTNAINSKMETYIRGINNKKAQNKTQTEIDLLKLINP